MTTKVAVYNTFRLVGGEPQVWFDQAQGLLCSARVLRDRLLLTREIPPGDRRIETNGLVNSIMLLLGLSMENLIKGAYIARYPELVSSERLDRSRWMAHGGHAIRDFAARLITLNREESSLLEQLQEYIVWAGKYPIPTKAKHYYPSRDPETERRFSTSEFELVESLFERLTTAP